jgi:hypothetical protein
MYSGVPTMIPEPVKAVEAWVILAMPKSDR